MDDSRYYEIAIDLSSKLAMSIQKRGYFFLTNRGKTKYWIDLYALSHLFNKGADSITYREFLKDTIKRTVEHQKQNIGINAVIVPRWTCCTEDLFSETLLNICFDLYRADDKIAIYELFSAGGGTNEYYLSLVDFSEKSNKSDDNQDINAVALLTLDIHAWLIDDLLYSQSTHVSKDKSRNETHEKKLFVPSIVSLLGRVGGYPKYTRNKWPDINININKPDSDATNDIKVFPLFDASDKKDIGVNPFPFILDKEKTLYKSLFEDESYDYKKYIQLVNDNAQTGGINDGKPLRSKSRANNSQVVDAPE